MSILRGLAALLLFGCSWGAVGQVVSNPPSIPLTQTGPCVAGVSATGTGSLTCSQTPRVIGLNSNSTISYSGNPSLSNSALFFSDVWSGTSTGGSTPLNYFGIGGDSINSASSNYVSALRVYHGFGGGSTYGARSGVSIETYLGLAANDTSNATAQYVGSDIYVHSNQTFVGSGSGITQLLGAGTAGNFIAGLDSGAANWYTIVPDESDVYVCSSCSVGHKFGKLIVETSGDYVAGSYDDAAIAFSNASTAPGWSYLIQLQKTDGSSPTNASSTILGSRAITTGSNLGNKALAKYGIDFADNFTWTAGGLTYEGPGYSVSSDNAQINAGPINSPIIKNTGAVASITLGTTGTYTAPATCSISAPNQGSGAQATCYVATYGLSQWVLNTAGTGYSVNDVLTFPNGTCGTDAQLQVSAIGAGGSITTLIGHNAGSCSSPSFSSQNVTGGTGSGASLTAKWYINTLSFSGGEGYTSIPTVTFSTSSSGTATATASISNTISANNGLVSAGTTFTVSGCGTAGSIVGGAQAGTFTVGTGASNCTFVFTINGATGATAPHGWIANVDDATSGLHCPNVATAATTTASAKCTLTTTSDVMTFSAVGY